jgi:hypothetical protein
VLGNKSYYNVYIVPRDLIQITRVGISEWLQLIQQGAFALFGLQASDVKNAKDKVKLEAIEISINGML